MRTRTDLFDMTIASTVDYLRMVLPVELADVSFVSAPGPFAATPEVGVERYSVDARQRRITLYRLPIQRLTRLHHNDELHQRMVVESCVFRAVAELLGKDPWDLAPDRFRRF